MTSPYSSDGVPVAVRRCLRRRAILTLGSSVAGFVVLVTACERTLVEPAAHTTPTTPSRSVWPTPGGEDNSPAGATGPALAPPDTHSGAQPQASLAGYFKYKTIVQVTYSGSISRTTLFGPFPNITFGPMGQGGDNGIMWIGQSWAGGGSARAITGLTEIATFQYTINYGRNPSSQPSNDNPACGNVYNWRDCVRFDAASPSTVSYTVFDVGLNSAVSPASSPSHGLVRFDIGPSIDSIGGFRPGVEAAEWMWTPDDTVQNGGSRAIACGGANHCELFVDYNGTMRARAYTNGIMKEAPPMHVTVTDSIYMTVDKPYGPPDYAAFFTVHLDGATGMSINTWYWYPDDGSAPRQLTWCQYGWFANQSQPCGWNVPKSGKVVAEVLVNGSWRYPSKHVIVVPCPTNNPVLDDPEIRKSLKGLIDKSGPDLPPGDGLIDSTSVGNKREHAGNIYKRPDGTYYFVEDLLAAGTECSTARVPVTTPQSSQDVLVAMVHTHPTKTGLFVYGCPPDPDDGVPRKRGPWDTSTPWVGLKKADWTGGGGSPKDWQALRDHPANQVPYPQVPPVDGYTINADGEVWEMISLDAFRPYEQKQNRRMVKYSGNSNPSCDWTS